MFVKEASPFLMFFVKKHLPSCCAIIMMCDSRQQRQQQVCLLTRQCRIKAKVFSINEESRIFHFRNARQRLIVTVGVYERPTRVSVSILSLFHKGAMVKRYGVPEKKL
jgi:hypothetical protein